MQWYRCVCFVGFFVCVAACSEESEADECTVNTDCSTGFQCIDRDCVRIPDASAEDAAEEDAAEDASRSEDGGEGDSGPTLRPVPQPPAPTFPPVVATVSISIRTADGQFAGTDDPTEVCLSETDCFHLNVDEVNDLEPGQIDVHHFDGLALARTDVDRVVLRTRSPLDEDNDQYTPACLHIRFDGEPVYCQDQFPLRIGTNGSNPAETPSWRDPDGLHSRCTSCWNDQTLTHGPMLGAPTEQGARVWVRTDATRTVGLRVGEGADISSAPIVAWAQPSPDEDFTHVFEIDGLRRGSTYAYRVEVEGSAPSETFPMRARVPDDASTFSFAFGSCSRQLPQPALGVARAADPELFLFAGDNHYGNAQNRDAHRFAYRRFRFHSPERAMLQATVPSVAIWDDHDFLANNSHGACAHPQEALAAFRDYWANPAYGTDEAPGVFFRHREGPVEFFALDCRMYRPDVGDLLSRCDEAESPPTLDPAHGPLGAIQSQWLREALEDSDAPFKMLACGSRFTRQGSTDSWASFPEALSALESFLHEERIEGVVFLSGDIHRTLLRMNTRAEGYAIPEISSSPISIGGEGPCNDEPGQRFCVREDNIVSVRVDGGAEPKLTVDVRRADGEVVHTWEIPRAMLTYD